MCTDDDDISNRSSAATRSTCPKLAYKQLEFELHIYTITVLCCAVQCRCGGGKWPWPWRRRRRRVCYLRAFANAARRANICCIARCLRVHRARAHSHTDTRASSLTLKKCARARVDAAHSAPVCRLACTIVAIVYVCVSECV